MSDTSALTGGCLCGRVRFEARPDKREGYYCHCRMCQMAVGNTRAAFINLRKDQVTWTGAAPSYFASSKIARRGFCATCGTPLSFEFLESERMDLTVGAFDEPAALQPTSHFAVESRVENWHADDGLPGERLDASEKLNARWKAAYGEAVVPGLAATREP